MTNSTSRFVWYELMTTDAKAAEQFYRTVVGWGAQDAGQPHMNYTLLTVDGAPVAGLMALPPDACAAGARPGWTGVIGVDDADAAVARITEAGGQVHRAPDDIPNIGRFAVVADPQGAVFQILAPTPGQAGAPPEGPGPGHVNWRELRTSDWEKGFDFYAGQFGWTKVRAVDMGPMGVYQTFAAGGEAIGGMMNSPGAPPNWLFYFSVESIDAGAERVRASGGEVLQGPLEVPGGLFIIQGRDPQGADFALLGPRS
jgi:predicted enzyme related to lactoylglutathione lyase